MAYHIEGKDIVINGFEQGISDSIYTGAADMRNMETLTVPGEASVSLATSNLTLPPVVTALAFTAIASTNIFTVASTSGWYEGMAINFPSIVGAPGFSTATVYYVRNISGNTFKISVSPNGSTLDVTLDTSGTLTSYTYAVNSPISYWNEIDGSLSGVNATILSDSTAQVWVYFQGSVGTLPQNTLIFMGNIGGVAASGAKTPNGVAVWNGYLFLIGTVVAGTDILNLGNFITGGPAANWTYTWHSLNGQGSNGAIDILASQEDGNLYFVSTNGLDSIILTPGDSFDPVTPATYTINSPAVAVPATDEATCIAELGATILIGGRNSFVYVWDKLAPGFSGLLNVPDTYIYKIVATNQNAYVFAGVRGKIYLTNGSGMDLFKKIPDYLTGSLNTLYNWEDASFARNQLYFSFIAKSPAGTTLDTVAGAWVIDLDNDALRMLNKVSTSGYAGVVRMITPRPPSNSGSPTSDIVGQNITMGWYENNGNSVISVSSADPYTNYESYLDTELIPVGTFLDPFTPSQIEWKTSAPLVAGEEVRISYRPYGSGSWTVIGTSTTAGNVSDLFKANFQKVQWVQFRAETKSTATTPSYTRLTEIRVRDWPSGKNMPIR